MPLESAGGKEHLDQRSTGISWESFDSDKYSKDLAAVGQEVNNAKKSQQEEADELKKLLNDTEKEKVENFIKENCDEPIENVNKVVPFQELIRELIKSAEENNLLDVKKSIENRNYTDERIYKLPAYQKLLENGFILPSDLRDYYTSAEKQPVYHLGVDYNVKSGTQIKAIYDGEVISSGLDGGLGHKVIIEHTMPNGTKFYSLYGHMGPENLPKVGDKIEKGSIVGKVGKAFTPDNGNRNEHLHFQIMENKDSPEGYSRPGQKQIGNYDVLKAFGK